MVVTHIYLWCAVVDDIALVARETVTTFAEDWGMAVSAQSQRAPNQPIVFGCSWPGAAAVRIAPVQHSSC
jgi:hypothetical protein|eukprot:COSAG01_NODE_2447_length_7683_cov_10.152294_9_plen_70_part_00